MNDAGGEGRDNDPPQSRADELLGALYASLYRIRSPHPERLAAMQSAGASAIFHLRRAVRKFKLGQLPIRIVFLASEPQGWLSLHTLYLACLADRAFKVSVINVGWGSWLGLCGDCAAFFRRHGIEHIDGISQRYPLEKLKPDIVVTESPYDQFRPEGYGVTELKRRAKLVYISYGADFAGRTGKLSLQTFGLGTQKNSWRIFSRSPRVAAEYARYGDIPPRRIVGLGLPILDLYTAPPLFDCLPAEVREASTGKLKILYTPHHSLDGWSTFIQNGIAIRRLLEESKDWYLVFRPHPGLGPRLEQDGIMSQQALRDFFPPNRSYLYEGSNYHDAFRWSDLMISDASSFLVEYAPTRKPVIYLEREKGWGIDDSLQDDIFNGYYVARSEHDIASHMHSLQMGIDPLIDARHRCQSRMSLEMFKAEAGSRIAAYLHSQLA
jgi:hypothetical protein